MSGLGKTLGCVGKDSVAATEEKQSNSATADERPAAAAATGSDGKSSLGLLAHLQRFDLDRELVHKDNAALSLTFAGYMGAMGLMLSGDMQALSAGGESMSDMGTTALYSIVWALIGMLLMFLAHMINDHILMRSFSNVEAIVSGANVAAGLAEAGSYLAAGLVVTQIVAGADRSDESERWEEFASCVLWFTLSNLVMVVYIRFFEKFEATYDQQQEIHQKNAAAGLYFALHVLAVGVIISGAVGATDSLLTFFVWSVFGTAVTVGARAILKPRVLALDQSKSQTLFSEIKEDQNWGATLVVGVLTVSLATLCNTALRDCPYTAP